MKTTLALFAVMVLTITSACADELPYDYEIEYLQGDGTAYIDLGFKLTGAYSLDVVLDPERITSGTTCIIGARNTGKSAYIDLMMESGVLKLDYCKSDRTTYHATYNLKDEPSSDWIYELKISAERRALYHDGQCLAENSTMSVTNFTTGQNCQIYTMGYAAASWAKYTGKIYSVKITNEATGALEYDLIPVRKGNAGYLYNKVTGALFGNVAGAGAFVLGPTKPWPDTLIVTGEPGEYGAPDPAYGWYEELQPGEVRTLKAPAVWTNDAQTVFATCTGYKVYTNDVLYVQGSFSGDGEHSFDYVHPMESVVATVAWQFDSTYRVAVSTSGNGTVAVSGDGWFKPGDQVTVTAEPADGFGFGVWEGDTVANHLFDKTLVFTMENQPFALSAQFRKFVYVKKGGDDANGGTSWDDALATIPAALEKDATPYVLVGDGVYPISTGIAVEKPATISGCGNRGAVVWLEEAPPSTSAESAQCVFYVNHPQARLTGLAACGSAKLSKITENLRGRGVYIQDGQVDDCSVTNNVTQGNQMHGGGIKMTGGVVRGCLVANNIAKSRLTWAYHGGGVWMNGGLLERCIVRGNLAQSGTAQSGGGVWAEGGIVRNCLIVGNQVGDAGAASGANVKNALMENCTIVGNSQGVSSSCTGLRVQAGGVVRNTIVYYNTNAAGVGNVAKEDGSTFENVLTTDDCTGEGIINANPGFVDADNGDWHIGFGAAVDVGANQGWMAVATDLDGKARILNHIVDLGCYEYVPSDELTCSFDVTTDGALDVSAVTLTANVSGADPAEVEYGWTLTDSVGRAMTTNLVGVGTVTLPIPAGFYSVVLSVRAGEKTASSPGQRITVYAKDIYVSPEGTNEVPYRNFATGATNVNEALQLATDGSTVHLSDGVHRVAECVVLGAKIALVHEGDRESCILTGGKENDCLVMVNHAGARMSGMDIWGSYPQRFSPNYGAISGVVNVPFYHANGVRVTSMGGTVSNCVIECFASTIAGAGVNMSAGLLVDSLVRNNEAHNMNLSGGGVCLTGGSVERCVVSNNCVQSGKGGTHGGGVSVGAAGTLRNSLLVQNWSCRAAAVCTCSKAARRRTARSSAAGRERRARRRVS